jgi:hypothetical protein
MATQNMSVEKLLEKKRQLEALIEKKQAQAKEDARKRDNRKKIILGGVILAAVRSGEIAHGEVRALISKYAARYAHMFPEFAGDHAQEAQEPAPEQAALSLDASTLDA